MKRDPLTHKRPEWLDKGVVLTSLQEPLVFMRQCGGVPSDARERHFATRCESYIKRAKAEGKNLVILSGQKGAGIEAEREDIEASKRMARLCRKHGLHVGTYIGDTLLTTTAFREMPESRDWACVNAFGRPVYYGDQVFRQKGCRNNPGYMGFLKRVVKMCIEEIGVDFLHFDNFFSRPEPNRCRCRFCAEGFRRFVRAKYDDAALEERYGFTDLGDFAPPPVGDEQQDWRDQPLLDPKAPFGPPPVADKQEDWRHERIADPWRQDWIEYHCVALAEAYRELGDYARSLKPDIAVEINPYGLVDRNTAMVLAVDHPRLLPHGDCFWSEEHFYPGIDANRDMVTKIRTYKMARTLRQVVFTYVTPYSKGTSEIVSVAEALAFNQQSLARIRRPEGALKRYVEFRERHEELYVGTELLADASVLHNFETLAFHNWGPRLAARMAEQALIQGHVPFELIFDQQFAQEAPRVLVLADVVCLSDEQADLIRRRVREGMGLVATGGTGAFTPWVRRRATPALADLFGFRSGAETNWGLSRRREFGKGRVAYLRDLPPSRPLAKPAEFYSVPMHQLPSNWREFVEAVQWAGGAPSVELLAPPTLAAEFLTQPGRLLVHLVNYNPDDPISGVELRLAPRLARGKKRACLLSPDEDGPVKLDLSPADGGKALTVPFLDAYGIVVVE